MHILNLWEFFSNSKIIAPKTEMNRLVILKFENIDNILISTIIFELET